MKTSKRVLFSGIMLSLVALTAGGALWGYVHYTRKFKAVDWPRRWRHALFYFRNPAARDLVGELSDMYSAGVFSTVWCSGVGVHLSKKLYTETDMSGRLRYAYKPGLRKLTLGFYVGPGMLESFEIPATQRSREIMDRLKPAHLAEARYDENGFRDSRLPPRGDLPVIVFLGDSFTDGYFVADDETFTHYFGSKSAKAGYGWPVNTGVGGYDTLEEYHALRKALGAYENIGLVVVHHYANDVATDYDAVVEGTARDLENSWKESFRWLDKIRAECSKRGIPLALAAVPTDGQVWGKTSSRLYQERLGEYAERHGLPFFDPLDALAEHGAHKVYLEWDPHFSPEGNRLYARLLWDFVRARWLSLRSTARKASP